MAKRRTLKKEINDVTNMLITDAIGCLYLEKNQDKAEAIFDIINEAVNLRNENIIRISHVDGAKNPKMVSDYFKKLRNDFLTGTEANFKKLSETVKQ